MHCRNSQTRQTIPSPESRVRGQRKVISRQCHFRFSNAVFSAMANFLNIVDLLTMICNNFQLVYAFRRIVLTRVLIKDEQ